MCHGYGKITTELVRIRGAVTQSMRRKALRYIYIAMLAHQQTTCCMPARASYASTGNPTLRSSDWKRGSERNESSRGSALSDQESSTDLS